MRKFLVWSALAVVFAAVVAAGGYWAYWNFHARFQPTLVTRNQAEIQRLLDEASWVSSGGGGEALYMIGWRDCASCRLYEREEFPKLRAAGVETRVIIFARPDREGLAQSTAAERATVAELWLTREWSLYQRWIATPARNWTAAGIPAADGNLARSAVVEAGRQFQVRLETLLRGAGVRTIGYPLILWRDAEGYLKVCACTDARSFAFIRDDLGAPDSLGGDAPRGGNRAEDDAPLPAPIPGEGLPALPPQEETPQAAPEPAPAPAPAPTQPAEPRAPPQPRQQEDSVFF